jgi:hypothetical protein
MGLSSFLFFSHEKWEIELLAMNLENVLDVVGEITCLKSRQKPVNGIS